MRWCCRVVYRGVVQFGWSHLCGAIWWVLSPVCLLLPTWLLFHPRSWPRLVPVLIRPVDFRDCSWWLQLWRNCCVLKLGECFFKTYFIFHFISSNLPTLHYTTPPSLIHTHTYTHLHTHTHLLYTHTHTTHTHTVLECGSLSQPTKTSDRLRFGRNLAH